MNDECHAVKWTASSNLPAEEQTETLPDSTASMEKKNVFFRALPEPLPPDPNLGNLVLFSDVKIQDLKVSLELKILYILYDILYI